MNSKLSEKMQFILAPVGIYFTDDKPDGAIQFKEGEYGCVAAMLIASAKGETVVFDEKTYGCAGGGAGLCFGDTFAGNPVIDYMMSKGDESLAAAGAASERSLGRGLRFYATPELSATLMLPKLKT